MRRQPKIWLSVAVLSVSLLALNAQAGLIAYWDFESAAGANVTDVSGNGIVGVMSGGAALTTGGGGYTGEGLDITGDDTAKDIMTVTKGQFTPYNPLGNSFSVSMWVKPNNGSWNGLADHANTDGYALNLGSPTAGQSKPNMVLGDGSPNGSGWEVPSTTSLTMPVDGNWHHLALVVDRTAGGANGTGTFAIYVDGTAETTYTYAWDSSWADGSLGLNVGSIRLDNALSQVPPYPTDVALAVGAQNGVTSFQGYIDDYAIYDQALTPTEVAGLADGSLTPDNLTGGGASAGTLIYGK